MKNLISSFLLLTCIGTEAFASEPHTSDPLLTHQWDAS